MSIPAKDSVFKFNPQLQSFLTGKQLLLEDIPFPKEEIQQHFENGYIQYRPGLIETKKRLTCNRCGNQDPSLFAEFPCARCGGINNYCRKCIMMGRVSSCTSLVGWSGPSVEIQPLLNPLRWEGELSEGQKLASTRVVDAVDNNQDLIVWAVCIARNENIS